MSTSNGRNPLVAVINRMRSQGWKYDQIIDRLIKMGNSPQAAESAITEYINEVIT